MREKYLPPVFKAPYFHCLFCGVCSQQVWRNLLQDHRPAGEAKLDPK